MSANLTIIIWYWDLPKLDLKFGWHSASTDPFFSRLLFHVTTRGCWVVWVMDLSSFDRIASGTCYLMTPDLSRGRVSSIVPSCHGERNWHAWTRSDFFGWTDVEIQGSMYNQSQTGRGHSRWHDWDLLWTPSIVRSCGTSSGVRCSASCASQMLSKQIWNWFRWKPKEEHINGCFQLYSNILKYIGSSLRSFTCKEGFWDWKTKHSERFLGLGLSGLPLAKSVGTWVDSGDTGVTGDHRRFHGHWNWTRWLSSLDPFDPKNCAGLDQLQGLIDWGALALGKIFVGDVETPPGLLYIIKTKKTLVMHICSVSPMRCSVSWNDRVPNGTRALPRRMRWVCLIRCAGWASVEEQVPSRGGSPKKPFVWYSRIRSGVHRSIDFAPFLKILIRSVVFLSL